MTATSDQLTNGELLARRRELLFDAFTSDGSLRLLALVNKVAACDTCWERWIEILGCVSGEETHAKTD